MIKTLVLFLSLFSATFCQAQTKTETDLYVAGYRNEDFNTAYLAFIKKNNDSLFFCQMMKVDTMQCQHVVLKMIYWA